MARQEFPIGAPQSELANGLDWRANVLGEAVPGEFLAVPSNVFYTSLYQINGASSPSQAFFLSTDPTDTSGTGVGQELSTLLENSIRAFTVEAGALSITIPGPNHSSNLSQDTAEPYIWSTSSAKQTEIQTFITAFFALTQAEKDATVLILDDGVDPVDVDISFEAETGSPETSFTLEAEDPNSVTLTDSSVGKTSAGRVALRDSAQEAIAPASWFSSAGTEYLVRVQAFNSDGSIRVYFDTDPTNSGGTAGPDITEIPLSDLQITLTSPAGSVTVGGFDTDADGAEPYIFTASDVAGVQAWTGGVSAGDSCSARVQYVPVTNQDIEFEIETGSPEADITVEGQDINRDISFEAETGDPEVDFAVEAEAATNRDIAFAIESGSPEVTFNLETEIYDEVTLTDSSGEKSGTAVIIRDVAEVAQVPVTWFAAGSVPAYLVRVRIILGNGAIEVRVSTDPTGSGSEAGPSVLVSLLSNLAIELTSPAGSIAVSGFGTDTSEPYVFLPSDVAGVQAWANNVVDGNTLSARIYRDATDRDLAFAIESGGADADIGLESEQVAVRDLAIAVESGNAEALIAVESVDINRDVAVAVEAGSPEASVTVETQTPEVTDRDVTFAIEAGSPEASAGIESQDINRDIALEAEAPSPEVSFAVEAEAVTNRDIAVAIETAAPEVSFAVEGQDINRDLAFEAETGSPETSLTLEAEDLNSVTLTDSSVVKNNAGRVTINDSTVEAQIPAEWLSATGAQYLVRVQIIGNSGQIRVYLDDDPTNNGVTTGPNLDLISLAGLRLTLTSPAGSVTVQGFESDANEPYIFLPSDVAGVQAWTDDVTTGDACSARIAYVSVTNRDLAFEVESGVPEASIVPESETIVNADISLAIETENPEISMVVDAVAIALTDRDVAIAVESGDPEADITVEATVVVNRDFSFEVETGSPEISAVAGVGFTNRDISFEVETGGGIGLIGYSGNKEIKRIYIGDNQVV